VQRILTLLCGFSLCAIPGLAQTKSAGMAKTNLQNVNWSSRSMSADSASKMSAMSDQQFVDYAGQTDMVDANLGQSAGKVVDSQQVKDLGHKLVTDETNDFQALLKAARQSNLNVPRAIDRENDRALIDPIQHLTGSGFDRSFVREIIAGDTTAIGIYKREAAQAQTPALRSYAEEALPILQADLDKAKQVEMSSAPAKKG